MINVNNSQFSEFLDWKILLMNSNKSKYKCEI